MFHKVDLPLDEERKERNVQWSKLLHCVSCRIGDIFRRLAKRVRIACQEKKSKIYSKFLATMYRLRQCSVQACKGRKLRNKI